MRGSRGGLKPTVEGSEEVKGTPFLDVVLAYPDPKRTQSDRHQGSRPACIMPASGCGGVMRVLVTGGAGFLGRHIVERLRSRGDDVSVPRSRDFDLTRHEDVERCLAEMRP